MNLIEVSENIIIDKPNKKVKTLNLKYKLLSLDKKNNTKGIKDNKGT